MQPLQVRDDSTDVQVVNVEPQLPPEPEVQPEQECQVVQVVNDVSKIDLKIPSFIPVSANEPTQKTDDDNVTVINTEEIDLLPTASTSGAASAVVSVTQEGESAPAVPPHRETSGDVDKKSKNGKPRSRNRHKR